MSADFFIRFKGVRGQYPAPGKNTMEVGGNTPCVEVRVDGHVLILDAGTGIVGLGDTLIAEWAGRVPGVPRGRPIVATIFLSHTHHDHIQGFPFFSPSFINSSQIYLFGPKLQSNEIDQVLRDTMTAPYFPVDLHDLEGLKATETIRPGDVVYFDPGDPAPKWGPTAEAARTATDGRVQVRIMKSFAHPKSGVFIFRIEWRGKSVVYATDTESYHGSDTRLAQFARGADVLIHDAQYTNEEYVGQPSPKQGYGHSTPEMATAVAEAAGAGRLYLFHHDPLHTDAHLKRIERKAQKTFANTWLAREDEIIEV